MFLKVYRIRFFCFTEKIKGYECCESLNDNEKVSVFLLKMSLFKGYKEGLNDMLTNETTKTRGNEKEMLKEERCMNSDGRVFNLN